MKYFLQLILIFAFFQTTQICTAQVTKLSNNTNLEYGVPLGSMAVLISDIDSLWRTDGTPAGTFKYATNVAADSPYTVAIFANKIYFTGITAATGKELWVTDGTAGGTSLVKDINPGAAQSTPQNITVFNNALYFFANTPANGIELWKSDGTNAGTVLLKDINPGAGNSIGTTTFMFPNSTYLFFAANDGTTGVELWRTDGTPGGTIMLQDINPGAAPSNPIGLSVYGTNVLFNATDATNGAELWKTDGTPAGTMLIKDIAPGPFGSSPSQFLLFNGKIYFTALDFTNGFEPWVTDATTAGTTLVKDIDPGFNSGFPLLLDAAFISGKFYFPATTTANGSEVWYSDGTTAGTQLFKDINIGAGSSTPFFFLDFVNATSIDAVHSRLFNGKMFMEANNGINGNELWITDGTVGGTVMVKDINPGADSSINSDTLSYFHTTSGLYFTATDGTTGHELWKSDATPGNTNRVFDINPGNPGSYPRFITFFNGIVLFTANDGDNVIRLRDLFRLDGAFAPLPLQLLHFTASLYNRSVRLNWTTTSEINTKIFEIERSKNGTQFETIGSVNAAGNSSLKKDYMFDDVDALHSGVTKLFYRLKIIDRDGRFYYSKIIVFNMNTDTKLLFTYPNPANGQLMVKVNSQSRKQVAIEITDENGKQLYKQALNNVEGSSKYNINVSSFAKGLYYIRLITDEGVQSVKFMKN